MRKQQSGRRDTSRRGEHGRERTSGVSGAACTAAHTDGQEAARENKSHASSNGVFTCREVTLLMSALCLEKLL